MMVYVETIFKVYCQVIKKSTPYQDAMEVCGVLDMGSGWLNISSGIDMLQKGIEGDKNRKVEWYGGGWITSKYHIQQVQEEV
jgi:hypothetical protein